MAGRKVVLVSGTYDILHAGHVRFFQDAKALGDELVVVIPTDEVVRKMKGRAPYLSAAHKAVIISELWPVDKVMIGGDTPPELNFCSIMQQIKPAVLAVTADDKFREVKEAACQLTGTQYVQLPKTGAIDGTCSTELRQKIMAPAATPVRVDLGGGWFDVPAMSRATARIVNCAITPMMSLNEPFYKPGGGIGGSAAWALLHGCDPVEADLASGAGWQDPAVIQETGLCVWQSGVVPRLILKAPGNILMGRMTLKWTGTPHSTPELVDKPRDYAMIEAAGIAAEFAVRTDDYAKLCRAVSLTYSAQMSEGMAPIHAGRGCKAMRYCGSGWGGYILRMYDMLGDREHALEQDPDMIAIEPYIKEWA